MDSPARHPMHSRTTSAAPLPVNRLRRAKESEEERKRQLMRIMINSEVSSDVPSLGKLRAGSERSEGSAIWVSVRDSSLCYAPFRRTTFAREFIRVRISMSQCSAYRVLLSLFRQ